MRLPTFLIVGAAKSGTTSMYHYLRAHPDVFMPYLKEPGFLTGPEPFGTVKTLDHYADLFADAEGRRAVGEASPIYLPDPQAPPRIEDVLGRDVQILIMLRNPVDMVHSLWSHRVRQARESLSFQEAIKQALSAAEGTSTESIADRLKVSYPSDATYPYVYQARYSTQVARYQQRFEACTVHIFEDFATKTEAVYRQTCRFLGVDPTVHPTFDRHNPSGATRSAWARQLITGQYGLKNLLKPLFPFKWRKQIKHALVGLNTKPKAKDPLPSGVRQWIASLFQEDVEHLETLLERELRTVWPDFAS